MPTAEGIVVSRVLARSFAPASNQSGFVRAFIQTREYSLPAIEQTAALRSAAVLQGVTRTQRAWVDRTLLRFSFQVKDDLGSPLVDRQSYSSVALHVTSGTLGITRQCDGMPNGSFYLGYCAITNVDAAWFAGGGTSANVSIRATLTTNGTIISAALEGIQFIGQPAWYDPLLRSATVTNARVPPPDFNDTIGLFVTLPTSPVCAGEPFFANVYVDTRGSAANSWRLKIFFNTSLLKFFSVEVRSGCIHPGSAHARMAARVLHARCVAYSARVRARMHVRTHARTHASGRPCRAARR